MRKIIDFNNVYIADCATTVGKDESEGPLAGSFDNTEPDPYFGKQSFEKAEAEMNLRTLNTLLGKCRSDGSGVDAVIGGDLLNQCTATSFAVKHLGIPFLGLYGACTTIAEAILIGSGMISAGAFDSCIAMASSHFCSAERQYRFPLEYGNQRTPTSQNTVTGCGAFMLTNAEAAIKVDSALVGIISDNGIKDQNNMGAAMATAAVNTIERYFEQSALLPCDFDLIATGDLGKEGKELAEELFRRKRLDLFGRFTDCGTLIYDIERQDMHSGGSGCGCLATVLGGYLFRRLKSGSLRRIMLIGTGALMNPNSILQGESIPSVAHLITLSAV